jgi:hypothetical protein
MAEVSVLSLLKICAQYLYGRLVAITTGARS